MFLAYSFYNMYARLLLIILLHCRTTVYTEYNVLARAHGNTTFTSTVHYNHYRSAWYALSLLAIDFVQGFQCAECGTHPQTLIMDATGLSFRRELDFWKDNLMVDIPEGKVPKGR